MPIQKPASPAAVSEQTRRPRRRRVLPGFGLTLGFTVLYLSLIVLIPLSAAFTRTADVKWKDLRALYAKPGALTQELELPENAGRARIVGEMARVRCARIWRSVSAPRVLAAYRISLGASFGAALINATFGLLVAWVLVRYRFPGKRIVDAMVDLPFALPTAVAGIALTQIYAPNGWLGHPLAALGIRSAYSPLGVLIALTFIGIPFVVRTVQPVLEDLSGEFEEAAESLGATSWQTFRRVIFPELLPSLLTGFALAFARALGEYGSVVFISGNLPMKTEIVPLLIVSKLEQYDYRGATAIACVMLIASFVMLLIVNLLQRWASAYRPAAA